MLTCGFNIKKISGLIFVNPNIPTLKYGRAMEENAANCFFDFIKKKHKNVQLHECRLYLNKGSPYIGSSPDRILLVPVVSQLVWRLNAHIQLTICLYMVLKPSYHT